MAFVLRDYQQEAAQKGIDYFKSNVDWNGVEILPTGSGKSLVIAAIIKGLGNEKTLVLQPSKEILIQNFNKYRQYGFYASVFSASAGRKEMSSTVFATIGSIVKRLALFKSFKYIIIDECHKVNPKEGMYSQLIKELPHCKILGLTATPYRLSTDSFGGSILKFITRTRPRMFKNVIYYVQNKYLFERGYLAKLEYFQIGKFNHKGIKKNTTGADFDERALKDYYKKIDLRGNNITVIKRLMELRKRILVFVRYIDDAKFLCASLPGAVLLTGETPDKERDKILLKYKSGDIQVLINIGVLTVGYDDPEIDTIVMARETMSLALYYQILGRGIRPHPNKESCWIVDTCGNFNVFGKIEDLHIDEGTNGKWAVTSKGVPLTNEYFGEVYEKEDTNPKLF